MWSILLTFSQHKRIKPTFQLVRNSIHATEGWEVTFLLHIKRPLIYKDAWGFERKFLFRYRLTRIQEKTAMDYQSNTKIHIQTFRPRSNNVSSCSNIFITHLSDHFYSTIINYIAADVDIKQGELKNAPSFSVQIGCGQVNSAGSLRGSILGTTFGYTLICSCNDVWMCGIIVRFYSSFHMQLSSCFLQQADLMIFQRIRLYESSLLVFSQINKTGLHCRFRRPNRKFKIISLMIHIQVNT